MTAALQGDDARSVAASGGHNGRVTEIHVLDDAADDHVLEAQLAHLDAIERRQELIFGSGDAELTGSAHHDSAGAALPEEAWPEAIPDPPAPEDDLGAHLAWMEQARDVLGARAARNRDELMRVSSQWLIAQRHLDRVRPEEVSALVEGQARLRERIAADETAGHLLRTLATRLAAWETAHPAPETPMPEADLALVRSLLDESAEQRARATRRLSAGMLEVLCDVALDLEVTQRQIEADPSSTAEAFAALSGRLAEAVENLRTLPAAEVIAPADGEPLHRTLQRCTDPYRARLAVDVAWGGVEPEAEAVRSAVAWATQEFLIAACDARATSVGVGLSGGHEGSLLTLSADAPLAAAEGGVEPGWLLRCRARVAVGGGVLAVDAVSPRCVVEVRFPA